MMPESKFLWKISMKISLVLGKDKTNLNPKQTAAHHQKTKIMSLIESWKRNFS